MAARSEGNEATKELFYSHKLQLTKFKYSQCQLPRGTINCALFSAVGRTPQH